MNRQVTPRLLFILCLTTLVACSESTDAPTEEIVPCGVRSCSADGPDDYDPNYNEPGSFGKADAVERVLAALTDVTADQELDAEDVTRLFDAAGNRVSRGEMEAIRQAVFDADDTTPYLVLDEAREETKLQALEANLSDVEKDYLRLGYRFSREETPEKVREALANARLQGAEAYDVSERDDDGELVWTPYPATTPASENMAFDYTEITPAKLQADLEDTEIEYNAIIGTETAVTASGQEYKQAKYEKRKGGTGNILSHYDEVYHPDIYARGRSGQKWANNFAILADGSIHCLPAARRSYLQDLILTNPHLSRGARLLFNGHLDVREGVVVGIEMSGRLSKLAAKGKANFIDPVPLLEAWGFEIAPGVTIRYGNTSDGVPVQVDGVIKAADE